MELSAHDFLTLPIVYTTKLEDMVVLKNKEISKLTFEDVIQSIIVESKPRYNNTRKRLSSSNITTLHAFFYKRLKLKGNTESDNNQNILCTIEIAKSQSKKVNDSMHEISTLRQSMPRNCKKPRFILEDSGKLSKEVDKNKTNAQIPAISTGGGNVKNKRNTKKRKKNNRLKKNPSITSFTTIIQKPIVQEQKKSNAYFPPKNVIKSVYDFKDKLDKHDIKYSIIKIYNPFLNKSEAYQIGAFYNVTDYVKSTNCVDHEFNMKSCKSIFNIVVCCWKKRYAYVLLMRSYNYNDIAHFMYTLHSCPPLKCICCCSNAEKSDRDDLHDVSGLIEKNYGSRHQHFSCSVKKESRNLITYALDFPICFKKETKWKGYQERVVTHGNINTNSTKILHLKNVYTGLEEYYEWGGHGNIINSRVINNGRSKSCWLLKTISSATKTINFDYIDLEDRAKYISRMKDYSYVPLSSYLKLPKVVERDTHRTDKVGTNTSSSMQTCPPVQNGTDVVNTTLEVSKNINALINDILQRFRGVSLTIDSKGKVSATLNTSLNTLSQSELKILEQILSRAQTQVDKLGVTPGACLNPNIPLLLHTLTPRNHKNTTPSSNPVTSTSLIKLGPNNLINTDQCIPNTSTPPVVPSASDQTNASFVHPIPKPCLNTNKAMIFIKPTPQNEINEDPKGINKTNTSTENIILTESDCLRLFTNIICEKKSQYAASFRSYIGEETSPVPKITHVFSLKGPRCVSSDNVETGEMTDDIKSNPDLIKDMCLKEIEQKMRLLDSNEKCDMSVQKMRQKPYSVPKDNTDSTMIRVKTAEDVSKSLKFISKYQDPPNLMLLIDKIVNSVMNSTADTSEREDLVSGGVKSFQAVANEPTQLAFRTKGGNTNLLQKLLNSKPKRMAFFKP